MPEGFGIFEAIITAFGTIYGVVFVGKQTGRIKTPSAVNPALTEQLMNSLAGITNTLAALVDRLEKVDEKLDVASDGIRQAVRKSHNAATLAAVAMDLAGADTPEEKSQAKGQMKRASEDWNATRRDFT